MGKTDKISLKLPLSDKKTEKKLKTETVNKPFPLNEKETLKLIHELQLHQLELEAQTAELEAQTAELLAQKAELELAKKKAEDISEKYIELYKTAPLAIFVLSPEAIIIDLNNKAATLLGKPLKKLISSQLKFFVSDEHKAVFNDFMDQLFRSYKEESCEIIITTASDTEISVTVTGIANKNTKHCQISVLDITKNKIAEEYENIKARFMKTMDLVNDGFFEWNIETGYNYYSPACYRMLGYEQKEFEESGLEFENLIHPEDKEIVLSFIKSCIENKNKRGSSIEYRMKSKEGSWRIILSKTLVSVIDKNSKAIILTGSHTDITKRRENEEKIKITNIELQKQNKLFNQLLKNLQSGVFMVEAPTGKPIIANDKALEILGRGILPDANKKNLTSICNAYIAGTNEKYPLEKMPIIRGINGETSYINDLEVVRPDGTHVNLEIYGSPLTDTDGHIWASLVNFNDITEKKKNEKALADSMQLYKELADSITDIVFTLDFDLNFIYCNYATEITFDYNAEYLKGKSIDDLFAGYRFLKKARIYFNRVINRNTPKNFEFSIDFDNVTKYFEARVYPTDNGVLVIIPDISKRKKQEKIIISQNEDFKSLFASNIIGTFISCADGRLIDANEYYLNIIKRDRIDLENGKIDWRKLTPPEWQEPDNKAIEEANKYGYCHPYEKEYINADGCRIPILISYSTIPSQKDSFMGFVLNITQRKQIEENEKKINQLLSLFVKHSPIYAFIKNVSPDNSQVLIASDNMNEITGIAASDMVGKNMYELFPAAFAEKITNDDFQILSSGKIHQIEEEFNNRNYITIKAPIIIGSEKKLAGYTIDITELKQNEIKLKKQAEQINEIIDLAVDGILIGSEEGIIIYANDEMSNITGFKKEELLGKHISKSIFTEESVKATPFEFDKLRNGETVTNQRIIKRKDGIELIVEMRTKIMPDKTYMSFYRDITQQKELEKSILQMNDFLEDIVKERTHDLQNSNIILKQAYQNYEHFFNTTDKLLFILDNNAKIITVNRTVLEQLGYNKEELTGKSIFHLYDYDNKKEIKKVFIDTLKKNENENEVYQIPLLTKHFFQLPVLTKMVKGLWNNEPVIFGVYTNISELRFLEEKFSKLFYINPSACGLTDIETHKYIEVNDAFCKLLGYEKHEVIGKTVLELDIMNSEMRHSILNKSEINGSIRNVDAVLKTKNGELKYAILSAENVKMLQKNYRFTVVQDITDKKEAENKLKNKISELSRLRKHIEEVREEERKSISRELHDDLGQSLTAIKIDLGIANQKTTDPQINENLAKIGSKIGDSIKKVQQITAYLRPSILEDLGLEAALDWQIKEFRERTGIWVDLIFKSKHRLTDNVSLQIYRVIQESLTNIARHSKATSAKIMINNNNEFFILKITDNGVGISKAEIKSKKSFGIMSMRERIESIKGSFNISHINGGGTETKIYIPVYNKTKEDKD